MKKSIYVGIFIVIAIFLLTLLGNRIAERTLEVQLARLLSRELGIPVTLAPVQARLSQLRVLSPKLIMGDPDKPALVAGDVEVALALADLLHGRIRLQHVRAGSLTVQPSRWPGRDGPAPDHYRLLEQWLPRTLQLDAANYLTADGVAYPIKRAGWQRRSSGGARLWWIQDRKGPEISYSAELKSLDTVLRLDRLDLDLEIQVAGENASELALAMALKPGDGSGYSLDTHIQASGVKARVLAGNTAPWRLPTSSTTVVDTLDIARLRSLATRYAGTPAATTPEALLASTLPELALQEHRGTVAIKQIRLNNEVIADNTFDFTTGRHGITISSFIGQGPVGILTGEAGIASSKEGWQPTLSLQMTAREADQRLAPQYLNSNWLWRSGRISLAGKGGSLGGLLYSLEGQISLAGSHRGALETPISLDTRLANRPGELSFEDLTMQLGQGRISGAAVVSGNKPRGLEVRLTGEQLDLDFLFTKTADAASPGVAIPAYLNNLAGFDLDWEFDINSMQMPGMRLATAQARLRRATGQIQATAHITGKTGGTLDLDLAASTPPDNSSSVSLRANLTRLDVPALIRQGTAAVDSRSSGTINLAGRGDSAEQMFKALRGTTALTVQLRNDHDWQREPAADEQLQVYAETELVVMNERITGVQVSKLDIDTLQQNLRGNLSIVNGRTPWLIADLESDFLDITRLLALRTQPVGDTDRTDPLQSIKALGTAHLSLEAGSLLVMKEPLSDVKLEVSSTPASVSVERLDLTLRDGRLKTRGQIKWLHDRAELQASGTASEIDLDGFLTPASTVPHVPLSGSVGLRSSGSTFEELLTNLAGNIDLAASAARVDAAKDSRRKLEMSAERLANGMRASISSFQWGENELTGSLHYHDTSPPLWELTISDGTVSLEPWEKSLSVSAERALPATGSALTRAAKASASLVRNVLTAPFRMIAGSREVAPGAKLFSVKPLPLDWLNKNRVSVKGQLASLTTSTALARDLNFTVTLHDGRLSGQASAGQLNHGMAELTLDLDSTVTPASARLTGSFKDVYGTAQGASYPRSGYVSLSSQGQSEAELAAHLNGMLYLQLGRGPLDYRNLSLLTTDVATSVFRTLLPDLDKQGPELECGVTLATFKEGIGITPYGYGARTRQANLVGRIEVDLAREMLKLAFDSSSREGLGISVGSVFSNTVQVSGPLTNPEIVPNTTGLLWRSWAAFMTAGLSVVGESVYKRALASDNPCDSINAEISKNLCGTRQPAASSPLVCPPA